MTPEIRALVQQVAANLALPAGLLEAQVSVESSSDPWAFRYERDFFQRYIQHNASAKGLKYGPLAACSFGLLQVLLETALELGFDGQPQDLFIPRVGLTWGAKYMRDCWHSTGGTPETYPAGLFRYNAGIGSLPPSSPGIYATKVYNAAGVPLPVTT